MKSKFNSRKCSFERKTNKALKLSGIALLGALFCVPCLKYEGVIDEIPYPSVIYMPTQLRDDTVPDNQGFTLPLVSYDVQNDFYTAYITFRSTDYDSDYIVDFVIDLKMTFNYDDNNEVQYGSLYWYRASAINPHEQATYTDSSKTSLNGGLGLQLDLPSNLNYISSIQWTLESDTENLYFDFGYMPSLVTTVENSYATFDMGVPFGVDTQDITELDIHSYAVVNFLTLFGSYSSLYQNGYNDGWKYGVDYVLNHLEDYNLYTASQYHNYGLEQYWLGMEEGGNALSLSAFVREIFKAPVSMFGTIFDWQLVLPDGEVINVLPIMTFLLTIGIALGVVHLILKIG